MVAANAENGAAIDLDFLQGLASELTDDSAKFGQSIGGDFLSPSHSCQLCHQTFNTGKMLQAHNQAAHADKTFVCEICGKAFRFRSNLAEHRSVHTAIKPFVCKYCGKSSRLKGNLTKHILKHHKMEQIDCIGKDDIIIKKGKKSVKDPAAIDFLEKSMIVIQNQNSTQAGRFGDQPRGVGSGGGAWDSERSSDGGTPSDELSSQDHGRSASGGFLMPFGGSDETGGGGADDSPDGSCVSTSRASSMNLGDYNNPPGLHAHTANDQLLERCKMEIDEEEAPDEEEDDENDEDGEPTDGNKSPANNRAANLSSIIGGLNSASNRPTNNTVAMAAAACKAILFGNMAAAANAKRSNSCFDGRPSDDSEDVHVIGSIKRASGLLNAATPTTAGGPIRNSSQCPECGKHLRKPRDLVTHLATIHNISPNSALANGCSSSSASSTAEGNGFAGVSAVQELQNLQKLMSDLKNTSQNVSPNNHSGMLKVNQMVMSLDGRVRRLEKQVEMALNSIYTLVQLQTGINNQMTRFRDETGDQLRNVINILSEGKTTRGEASN